MRRCDPPRPEAQRSSALLRSLPALLAPISILTPSAVLSAQDRAEVTYKHYESCKNKSDSDYKCTIKRTVRLSPGGILRVVIEQTDTTLFDIDVRGYRIQTTDSSAGTKGVTGAPPPPSHMVKKELTHSSQYGGYVVTISPKKVPLPADTPEAPTPGAAVIVIEVEPDDPGFKFGGGISVTGLRDPVFVARKVEGTESYEVVRDDSRRDAGTVGFATFLNVRAGRGKFLRDLWPGIGIGLETGGNTQYYFGLGLRINAVGIFVNGGAVLGQTAMLPAGLKEGDSISDPNLLATLPKQNKVSWFIGASFSFLGGGKDTFGKPFAGAEPEKQ